MERLEQCLRGALVYLGVTGETSPASPEYKLAKAIEEYLSEETPAGRTAPSPGAASTPVQPKPKGRRGRPLRGR